MSPIVYESSAYASLPGSAIDPYLTYDDTSFEHSVTLADRSFLPGQPYLYKVKATLSYFPTIFLEREAYVYLEDPCLEPLSLTSDSAVNSQSDYSTPASFNFPTW